MNRPAHKNASSSCAAESLAAEVRSFKAGDDSAFDRIVASTEAVSFRYALSLLKNVDSAQDALQEAYLTVFRRIDHLRDPYAFRSWLYRIVGNCCHQILRKRAEALELKADSVDMQPPLWTQDQHDPANLTVELYHLRTTFDNLPEIDRTVLALREICSLSYEEIGQVLQIPLGTVRSRLTKARQRFVDHYQKEGNP